jgi:prepilin-type N-terminal cleavage/methylation domain-containing protein
MGGGRGGVGGRCAGFTLFELVLVVLVIGIAAAALVPAVGNVRSPALKQACNVVAADVDFCMSECINKPDTPRKLVFDVVGNTYKMVDAATGTTIVHPGDGMAYQNDFSTGRTGALNGVRLVSVVVGATTPTVLTFDSYGRPLITGDMAITLSFQGQTMVVTVKAGTGDVSIQ